MYGNNCSQTGYSVPFFLSQAIEVILIWYIVLADMKYYKIILFSDVRSESFEHLMRLVVLNLEDMLTKCELYCFFNEFKRIDEYASGCEKVTVCDQMKIGCFS